MKYRPEIDGLRALAVLPVILFHAGVRAFSGGYVGVDVFFVISGYLITSIILTEKEAGRFSIVGFYERRARRILPALFFVMLACLPFAWWLLLPSNMQDFSESMIAVSTFASNFFFWRKSGYFDGASELKPLLHTWSLAVEEQYYLLAPAILLLLYSLGRRRVAGVLVALGIASLAAAHWAAYHKPDAAFYLLPARGWELIIGAVIALYPPSKESRIVANPLLNEVAGMVGIALIAWAVFAFDNNTPFPSLYALIPTAGVALIIVFANPQTLTGKLLGNKFLVGVGLISYSAYLWHHPLFAFARLRSLDTPSERLILVLAASSFALAYFSWRYVERPFRDRRQISRKTIFSLGFLFCAVFIVLGIWGDATRGFENRFTAEQRKLLAYSDFDYVAAYREGECFLRPEQNYRDFSSACASTAQAGGARSRLQYSGKILIWGDSHSAALANGLRSFVPNLIQFSASACAPFPGVVFNRRVHCKQINGFVLGEVGRIKPEKILLHANWRYHSALDIASDITKTIEDIRRVSPSSEIYIVGGVPQWPQDLPVVMIKMGLTLDQQAYIRTPLLDDLRALDAKLRSVAATEKVSFLSALDAFCVGDRCQAVSIFDHKAEPTIWDTGHLTNSGSAVLAKTLLAQVGLKAE